MRRGGCIWLMVILLAAGLSGCGTFVSYSGPELPPSERATLQCYWRFYVLYMDECHVTAIDRNTPTASQVAGLETHLSPGPHRVEIGLDLTVGGKGGGGHTHLCAFDFDFTAGSTYRVDAHGFESSVGFLERLGRERYNASLRLHETDAAGRARDHLVSLQCTARGTLQR